MPMKIGKDNVQPGPIEKDWKLPDRSPGISGRPLVGPGGQTAPLREVAPNAAPVRPQRPPNGR